MAVTGAACGPAHPDLAGAPRANTIRGAAGQAVQIAELWSRWTAGE